MTYVKSIQEKVVCVGIANGKVIALDISSSKTKELGCHNGPVVKLIWLKREEYLISLASDNTIKVYKDFSFFFDIQLPQKTYCAGFSYPYLIVGGKNSFFLLSIQDEIDFKSRRLTKDIKYSPLTMDPSDEIRCLNVCVKERIFRIGTLRGILHLFKFSHSDFKEMKK